LEEKKKTKHREPWHEVLYIVVWKIFFRCKFFSTITDGDIAIAKEMQHERPDVMQLKTEQAIQQFAELLHTKILDTYSRVRHVHNGYVLQALFDLYPSLRKNEYEHLLSQEKCKDPAAGILRDNWKTHIVTITNLTIPSNEFNTLCTKVTIKALKMEYETTELHNLCTFSIVDGVFSPSNSDVTYTAAMLSLMWDGLGPASDGGRDFEPLFKKIMVQRVNERNIQMQSQLRNS